MQPSKILYFDGKYKMLEALRETLGRDFGAEQIREIVQCHVARLSPAAEHRAILRRSSGTCFGVFDQQYCVLRLFLRIVSRYKRINANPTTPSLPKRLALPDAG